MGALALLSAQASKLPTNNLAQTTVPKPATTQPAGIKIVSTPNQYGSGVLLHKGNLAKMEQKTEKEIEVLLNLIAFFGFIFLILVTGITVYVIKDKIDNKTIDLALDEERIDNIKTASKDIKIASKD